jgi:hypothetical protein
MTLNLSNRAWILPLDKNGHLEVAHTYTFMKTDKIECVDRS